MEVLSNGRIVAGAEMILQGIRNTLPNWGQLHLQRPTVLTRPARSSTVTSELPGSTSGAGPQTRT